jgi:hypothetical protein
MVRSPATKFANQCPIWIKDMVLLFQDSRIKFSISVLDPKLPHHPSTHHSLAQTQSTITVAVPFVLLIPSVWSIICSSCDALGVST